MRLAIIFAVLLSWHGSALADTGGAARARLLRYPDIHNDLVTFVYSGDIWIVSAHGGTAQRLTSHPGTELFPKFSPDGKSIAFTGQYDGDDQVYVIPVDGGAPKRLTSYPAWGPLPARWGYDNQVTGWAPDGNSVLFRSFRDQISVVNSRLYEVPVDGGLPQPLPMIEAGVGVFSPDGNYVVYSPQARDFRTWKGYRGGWAQDLWVYDMGGDATQITDWDGTDRDPTWNAKGIYYVSDRSGHLNLWRTDPAGEEKVQLTQHGDDVRWASGDANGNVVYELHGTLRWFGIDDTDRAIEVIVPDDRVHSRPRLVSVADRIEDFDLAPDGKRIALTARGDIFTLPVESGIVRNLTRSDSHERLATWSPDGNRVAYVSDASGEEELYIADDRAIASARQVTEGNTLRWYRLRWSPAGDRIAAGDHLGRIWVIDPASGRMRQVAETGAWYRQEFEWSPDGEYLAFSSLEPTFQSSIFLWHSSSGVTRVTSELSNEFGPVWHESGNYLYFFADRELAPQMGSFEWNYTVNRETTVRGVAMRPGLPHPFATVETGDTDADSGGSAILDGISSRVFRVPVDGGNYSLLRIAGNDLLITRVSPFYLGRDPEHKPELLAFSITDKEERSVTKDVLGYMPSQDVLGDTDQVSIASSAHTVLVKTQNGSLVVHDLEKDDPKTVDTSGLRKTIDPLAEWRNSFEESWRRFRDFFYVPNMHGFDWEAVGDRYRELLPHVSHRSDLNFLVGEMISELDVGHAYTFGGDAWEPERLSVSLLGASFELDASSNRFRIGRIMDGDNSDALFRSPLSEVGAGVSAGEYVLAIDGQELTGNENPYAFLREIGANVVELLVSPTPDVDDSRTVVVDALETEQPLHFFEWVEGNRRLVDQLSGGRIGYIFIPSMGGPGIREFIRSYYGQIRKDGLIVDVRGNLGGNVSQMILERLLRTPYSLGYVTGEKYPRVYPWGFGGSRVFTGEIAVIADETTLSDGEAFTWTFKQSGRGPVIGKRTWGGVVGISDAGITVDGGRLRVPQFAMADLQGNWVVEGTGVVPDIEVDNTPTDMIKGYDAQLRRAVKELLDKLGDHRPGKLPTPAPAPDKTGH